MKNLVRSPFYFFVALAACSLFCCASPARAQVIPNDTFNIAVTGFNSLSQGAFLVTPLTATFGQTQMFANAGLGGQTVTVSSSQSLLAGFYTAVFTISVPTNFVPAGTTVGGRPITSIQMEMGGFNAGTNTVDFLNPLSFATYTGSVLFSGGTLALAPNVTLTNGDRSLAEVEGVNSGASDISPFAVRSFTFTARFAAVPETGGTLVLMGLGVAGIALLRRRLGTAQR